MNYKNIILNKLLDKFENSKSLKGESAKKITIKLEDLPEYNIENYEEKKLFNDTVKELKEKQLIDYSWKKYESGNILEKIWLVKENVEKTYIEINRQDIRKTTDTLIEKLENEKFNSNWIENYKNDMIQYLVNNRKPNNLFPNKYSEDILKTLKILDNKKDYLKRTLSIKCFGDSKYFENNIEHFIIRIIKKYLLENEYQENYNDDEILLQVGISRYPEIFEFCGDLECIIENVKIEYKKETLGSYINSYNIKKLENIKIKNATTIIFIENKANYIDYILNKKKENEFVIYHGGMYSPTKGEFFKKIYESSKNLEYYHWSDIDIGGFNIFFRLQEIIPKLKPYLMNKEAFISKKSYWNTITKEYRENLIKMKEQEKYKIFKEVIEEMIKNNRKLEQEAFILVN